MPETDVKETSSSRRSVGKMIILVILLLLVGGGGFVGWTLLQPKSADDTLPAEGQPAANAAPVTYSLNTYIVNLMGNSGMSNRYLKVGVLLGIKELTLTAYVDEHKPLLNDAALILLSSKTHNDLATVEGKILLKQELISRMNQILGQDVVQKIYFSEFVVQ